MTRRAHGIGETLAGCDQSEMVCEAEPAVFQPARGRGGARGWTRVIVVAADESTARSALWMAGRNAATPNRLAAWKDGER